MMRPAMDGHRPDSDQQEVRRMKNVVRVVITTVLLAMTQMALAKPVIIEWYGDSTTTGVTFENGKYGKAKASEPKLVQAMLNGKLGKNAVVIKDRGAGGTTANQLINGTFNYTTPFAKQVARGGADIVIINFGINDAYTPAYTPELYAKDLSELVKIARAAGKIVLLETPNPIDDMHNESLWAYQHQALATGQRLGVPVISQWAEIMKHPEWKTYLGDKIHPTSKGYVVKSKISFPVIYPVVKSLLNK